MDLNPLGWKALEGGSRVPLYLIVLAKGLEFAHPGLQAGGTSVNNNGTIKFSLEQSISILKDKMQGFRT